MVGVDFDLALGINLSAIDIFRYIDWSLILLLHVRRWQPFFLPLSLPVGYCWVHVSFVLLTWIRETWLIFVVVVLVSIRLVDRVLVCVRWLFWYLVLVLTIFSVRIVFWNVLFWSSISCVCHSNLHLCAFHSIEWATLFYPILSFIRSESHSDWWQAFFSSVRCLCSSLVSFSFEPAFFVIICIFVWMV